MRSLIFLSVQIKSLPPTFALAIPSKSRIIRETGTLKPCVLTESGNLTVYANRIPANCGYSQADYPACLQSPRDPSKSTPRTYSLLNSGMFLCRPSKDILSRMKKMLDNSPLVTGWKFCDQDLIGTFFGGGGERPEKWGVTKEELGDKWMPVPYYYNALKPVRLVCPSDVMLNGQPFNAP